jgi:signal transduction histidine kinase
MAAPEPPTVRRLYRRRSDRLVAGVAGGLSDHLGVDVLVLRIGFVVTIVLGGLGVLLYAAFWVFVPQEPEGSRPEAGSTSRVQLLAFAGLALAALIVAQLLGFGAGLLWPAAAAVTGAAILWRQADETSRSRWRRLTSRGTHLATTESLPRTAVRYLAGVLLVLIGLSTFLAVHTSLPEARRAVVPVLVVVLGLLLVVGPWVLRAVRQLAEERTARIREHERVELAGRVHDSMLQTLTLIQRRADDPAEVRRLVRYSERELRDWLYAVPQAHATLRSAVAEICAEVEDTYRVTIDVVVVGDHPAIEEAQPLLQALREAVTNAAKHSGTTTLSVYVEVIATQLTAFVRDRGRGFDPDQVPADRYGVRESVVARMQRHGGEAVVRSSPASGTEVQLRLPLRTTAPA